MSLTPSPRKRSPQPLVMRGKAPPDGFMEAAVRLMRSLERLPDHMLDTTEALTWGHTINGAATSVCALLRNCPKNPVGI